MMNHMQEGIIQTIAFFDSMDTILTDRELFELSFGQQDVAWFDYVRELELLVSHGACERDGAYIFMRGRSGEIVERVSRGMLAEQKMTKARSAIQLLRWIPYIRMVAICNSLAFDMCRSDGDIDLFIVAKKGRVSTVHVLVKIITQLFGLRRHGFNIANRLCLSFFVSEDGNDMSRFALTDDDPYLAMWTRQVIPVFSIDGAYEHFWKANEQWLKKYFFSPLQHIPVPRKKIFDTPISIFVRKFLEGVMNILFPWLERVLLRQEQKKLSASARRRMRLQPNDVVVSSTALKFHEEDRRVFYKKAMYARVSIMKEKL